MKLKLSPDDPRYTELPCCIQIEMRGIGSFIQTTLGPFSIRVAEEWLRSNGFQQERPNLWSQRAAMKMDYCATEGMRLERAQAWVHLLQTPEDVNFQNA